MATNLINLVASRARKEIKGLKIKKNDVFWKNPWIKLMVYFMKKFGSGVYISRIISKMALLLE